MDFYPLIDKTKGFLPVAQIQAQTSTGLRILAVLDYSRRARSLGAPPPIVLMFVGLFDDE